MFIWEKALHWAISYWPFQSVWGLGECPQLSHTGLCHRWTPCATPQTVLTMLTSEPKPQGLCLPVATARAHSSSCLVTASSAQTGGGPAALHLCLSEAMHAACPPSPTTVCLPKLHGATPLAPHHPAFPSKAQPGPEPPARIAPSIPSSSTWPWLGAPTETENPHPTLGHPPLCVCSAALGHYFDVLMILPGAGGLAVQWLQENREGQVRAGQTVGSWRAGLATALLRRPRPWHQGAVHWCENQPAGMKQNMGTQPTALARNRL